LPLQAVIVTTVPLRVCDYMTVELHTVPPDTEITQAVRVLIDLDISGVLVTDADNVLLGILTERDCIAVATQASYYDDRGGPVSKFMSTTVETCAPNDNLIDVAVRMADSPYRRFPVVDERRLVGLLSRRDVMRALGQGSWFATSK
jgi:CBS domain-containing protein